MLIKSASDSKEIREAIAKRDALRQQALSYLLGLLFVAAGAVFIKKSGLGISPVTALPEVLAAVCGIKIWAAAAFVSAVTVAAQKLLGREIIQLNSLFQAAAGVVLIFFFSFSEKVFSELPLPETYLTRLGFVLFGSLLSGMGMYVYMKQNILLLPSEGFAEAAADRMQRSFSFGKCCTDIGFSAAALILQLLFLGGFRSFTLPGTVREGTFLAALCTGQLFRLIRKVFK